MRVKRITLHCGRCGAPFERWPSDLGRYCSRACHYAGRKLPIAERFWSKVDRSNLHGCWPWRASFYPDGYGQFKIENRNCRAPRVAWELTNGPIPPGLVVLHRCDNPPCVRPDHLVVGTVADNQRDMAGKGRGAVGLKNGAYTKPESRLRGERNGSSKLTAAQVLEIRQRVGRGGLSYRQLGREYGVSGGAIRHIVQGLAWKHVGAEVES